MKKIRFKDICLLHFVLFIYAIAMLLSKTASTFTFLSFNFIIAYGSMLLIMAIYALLWQQILKRVPLNLAFINKAVTIVWGVVFGVIIFKEKINVSMVIGMLLILIGIIVMVTKDE